MLPVKGASDAFESFDDGMGDHYVIPSEAAPHVGGLLDLSLLDVTKPAGLGGALT
ncbi:hypothetical protein ABH935_009961 [Catenulispora sp. GAS73]|uniref:hypothetical protein n=1 Tax=Catenulispora sp. GAS73 TaxID=3156269 RepID=UPI0035110644